MSERAWFSFGKFFLFLSVIILVQQYAHATTPGELNFCGGLDQRACCIFEAFPSCDGSYVEKDFGSQSCGIFSAGVCRSNNPNDKDFCGGEGQRACCATEAFPSCDTGKIELIHIVADPTACSGLPAYTCAASTSCGGEGERACTAFEQVPSCDAGLIELGGCSGIDCGFSSGWCYNPTPCGDVGQRACCGLEMPENAALPVPRDPCNTGLTQVIGVAGDATCGASSPLDVPPLSPLAEALTLPAGAPSLGTCTNMSKIKDGIPEPNPGWSNEGASDQTCESKGYADLHVHMFAHLAHGGGVLAGMPYDPNDTTPNDTNDGINKALRMDYGTDLDLIRSNGDDLIDPLFCDPDIQPFCGDKLFHGAHLITDNAVGAGTHEGAPICVGAFDLFRVCAPTLVGAGSNYGSPVFNGWPTWRSTTHQQVYYKWLERAWRGGLRLMGQLAVTNEALCTGSKRLVGTDCSDEMAPVDAQIQAAVDFQDYVDNLSGGPGQGWFRIVTTPQDARTVISEGKLAVVLGIEVANLFNCKKGGCRVATATFPNGKLEGETDEVYVKRKVDYYYGKGVRIIFPIHNFDNAFGGPATWQNAINAGNLVSEGDFWHPEDCPGEDYGFKIGPFSSWLIAFLGFGEFVIVPTHDGDASCNSGGLTPLGVSAVTYMMQKGIIVDVDHLSNKSFDGVLDIADQLHRPVIASHVQFFDLNKEEIRHERMRTKAQLDRIRNSGGMIAAMLKDDAVDTDNTGQKLNIAYTTSPSGKVIKDDCRHSSKTWAQMYQYAVDTMQGPVAMGSDFNGVAGHVGPRYGYDACGQNRVERSAQGRAKNKLEYPFTLPGFGKFYMQKTGERTFDFNVDGLAHIGLLPDMVADLKKIGMSDQDLDPLMESASGFADVWVRAEGCDPDDPTPDPACSAVPVNQLTQLGCEAKTVAAESDCKASAVSIANADTLAEFGTNLSQNPGGSYPLGVTSVTLSTSQADVCGVQPGSCTSTVTVYDNTAPSITCPQTQTAECQGATTIVEFPTPVVGADNCGVSSFGGCTSKSGDKFLTGTTDLTCYSRDDAELDAGGLGVPNTASCNFQINVTDTTAPNITCPSNITTECTGNRSAQATPGVATASDVCAGVTVSTHDPGSFPLGTTPLTYTATDEANNKASCTSNVTVQDTIPPQITCPPTKTVECTGNHAAPVTPTAATGSDICTPVSFTGPAAGSYPLGTTPVTYKVTDEVGLNASCSTSIVVQDTTPPTITSVQVTPVVLETLWPPSHKMKTVTLAVATSDICDTVKPVCQISQITSNEPIDGLGDGDTAPDWELLGGLQANLRAERSGTGNGRIYTLKVTCSDQAGNQSVGSTVVMVPKSQ
jgi:microsomal dipeptidase-like Zn-dependent dipeptidase